MRTGSPSSPDTPLECRRLVPVSPGTALNADLFRIETDGGGPPVVLKTFALKYFLVRWTIGRFLTRREYRTLRRLQGVEGLCKVARPGYSSGIFLEFIPGKPLQAFQAGELPEKVFLELTGIVEKMHREGVVHLDLGHRGNIVVTPDQRPLVIDFQSSLSTRGWPEWIAKRLRKIDELALLKWKAKRFGQTMTEKEEALLQMRGKLVRFWPFHHWFVWPVSRHRKIDPAALLKWKAKHFPRTLNEEDEAPPRKEGKRSAGDLSGTDCKR